MADPRILIVAGEASSDAHGAGLVAALRQGGFTGTFYGVGGPALEAEGVKLLERYDQLAVVGLVEVLAVLPRAIGLLQRLKGIMAHDPPDLFLPVDSPELNLRLARSARRRGVPVVYFVAPQVWAWRPRRVRALRRDVSELLVLFPFEKTWFEERGVRVTYVGHPFVDAVSERVARAPRSTPTEGLLLPGSRSGEVKRHLPVMAEAAARVRGSLPSMHWTLRAADRLAADTYEPWAREAGIALSRRPLVELAAAADIAIAASGTASFEAAITGTPTIVVYRVNSLTWLLARRMVTVPHVGMANLAAGRSILPELLQNDCRAGRIAEVAVQLLREKDARERMHRDLLKLRETFGPPGAYDRAAARVLEAMGER